MTSAARVPPPFAFGGMLIKAGAPSFGTHHIAGVAPSLPIPAALQAGAVDTLDVNEAFRLAKAQYLGAALLQEEKNA